MTPKEYFLAVARELDAVKLPTKINQREVLDFIWNLWERNIAPSIAAEFVIYKFGVGHTNKPN